MNKKLILRILGITSGIIIIISLFLPYIKDAGSLWQIYLNNKQIYLAIVIILFGLLPVILYSIDKKVEYTYMSVGALLFFIVSQAVNTLSTGTFSVLGIGFYTMSIGTILVTIVTFIVNRDSRVKTLDEQIAPISNNLSNPLDRNGLEVPIAENLEVEKTDGFINDNDSKESVNSNTDDDALGEEIPDYQPENGVNPVLAEFTSEVLQPEESVSEPLNNVETAPIETIQPTESTQTPITSDNSEIQSQNQQVVNVEPVISQPAVEQQNMQVSEVNNGTQEQTINVQEPTPAIEQSQQVDSQNSSILPQPEISFDDSPQEIVENTEPQFDIFGQPK